VYKVTHQSNWQSQTTFIKMLHKHGYKHDNHQQWINYKQRMLLLLTRSHWWQNHRRFSIEVHQNITTFSNVLLTCQ